MTRHAEVRAETEPPPGRPKRRLSRSLVRLAGLGIFAFLLTRIDVAAVLRTVRGADWTLIGVAVLLTAPFFVTKAWRWKAILERVGIDISLTRSTTYYGAGLFVGMMTPGQVGELSRAYYLRRHGGDVVAGAATVIVERALDLVPILVFAIPGLLLYRWGEGAATRPVVLLAAFGAIGLALALVWWSGRGSGGLARLRDRIRLSADRVRRLLGEITTPRFALFLTATTAAAFALYLLRLYLLLVALGASLPPVYFVLSMAFVSGVSLLPVSIAGIGTRDLAMVAVFTEAGLMAEQAIAMSILILFLYLVNVVWCLGAWFLAAGRPQDEAHA